MIETDREIDDVIFGISTVFLGSRMVLNFALFLQLLSLTFFRSDLSRLQFVGYVGLSDHVQAITYQILHDTNHTSVIPARAYDQCEV